MKIIALTVFLILGVGCGESFDSMLGIQKEKKEEEKGPIQTMDLPNWNFLTFLEEPRIEKIEDQKFTLERREKMIVDFSFTEVPCSNMIAQLPEGTELIETKSFYYTMSSFLQTIFIEYPLRVVLGTTKAMTDTFQKRSQVLYRHTEIERNENEIKSIKQYLKSVDNFCLVASVTPKDSAFLFKLELEEKEGQKVLKNAAEIEDLLTFLGFTFDTIRKK